MKKVNNIPLFSGRLFSLVLYLSIEEVETLCRGSPHFVDYIFIQHDSDVKDDSNELKEKHIHLLLHTDCPYKSTTIYNRFKVDERNVFIISPRDLTHDVGYLLHKGYPNKFQYSVSSLFYNSTYFLRFLDELVNEYDSLTQCVLDVARGLSHYEVLKRYGNLYVRNYSNICLIASELKYDVLKEDIDSDIFY